LVSTTHSPTDDRIFYREARSLSKMYEVTVIGKGPSDRVTTSGKITLVYLFAPRILHVALVMKTFLYLMMQRPRIIQCHEPDTLLLARLASRLRTGTKVVYDVHEHFPSIWSYRRQLPVRLQSLIARVLDVFEKSLGTGVDAIVVVSDSIGKRFHFARPLGPVVVPNVPWKSNYDTAQLPHVRKRELTVLYGGNVDEDRGFREYSLALKIVSRRYPAVKFLIIGSLTIGRELSRDLSAFLKRNGIERNLEVAPWLSYFDYYKALCQAKVGVVLFQPTHTNNILGLPNKLFDYMGAGIPVVASDFPEIRKVVTQAKCGVLVDPSRPNEIAAAISQLLSDRELNDRLGANGHGAVMSTYNWESVEDRYLNTYRSVLHVS